MDVSYDLYYTANRIDYFLQVQYSLKIVFFNRVIMAQQKKRRFLSENDDIRAAFPHKEDTGRIQTVVFGRGYAHLKNSTFILSAIVNEPYVVEKRFTTHFKDTIISFSKRGFNLFWA